IRSQNQPPSNDPSTSARIWRASRVLPTPDGPLRVTRPEPLPISWTRRSFSCARPMKRVRSRCLLGESLRIGYPLDLWGAEILSRDPRPDRLRSEEDGGTWRGGGRGGGGPPPGAGGSSREGG